LFFSLQTHHQCCGFCLLYLPVFCCIKKDKPMVAIPEGIETFLSTGSGVGHDPILPNTIFPILHVFVRFSHVWYV
jgi:hypothetical protein